MSKSTSRTYLALSVWLTAAVTIVTSSLAMGASTSISALLAFLCAAPFVVMLIIGLGAPPQTVAEILHSINEDRR